MMQAMKLDPADATLYSNRSLCHLRSGAAPEALLDANDCIKLKPEWTKGHYRKGCAHMALKVRKEKKIQVFRFVIHHFPVIIYLIYVFVFQEYKEACTAFMAGTKLNPLNDEMQDAFW
jgi:tetratricopeptide (TPR) repeat protein